MAFTKHTGYPYETPVTPKPKGTTRVHDMHTTGPCTGRPTLVVSYAPAAGVTFNLAKILVTWSGTDEQHIWVSSDKELIGEYYATAYVMDWFPPGTELLGNGSAAVEIWACAVVGTGTDLTGFIVGEES